MKTPAWAASKRLGRLDLPMFLQRSTVPRGNRDHASLAGYFRHSTLQHPKQPSLCPSISLLNCTRKRWTSFERYMAVLGKVQNGLRTAILTKVQAYFLPIQLAMYGKYVGGGDKAMKPRAGNRGMAKVDSVSVCIPLVAGVDCRVRRGRVVTLAEPRVIAV